MPTFSPAMINEPWPRPRAKFCEKNTKKSLRVYLMARLTHYTEATGAAHNYNRFCSSFRLASRHYGWSGCGSQAVGCKNAKAAGPRRQMLFGFLRNNSHFVFSITPMLNCGRMCAVGYWSVFLAPPVVCMQKAEWCGFPLNALFGEESRHGAELDKFCVGE